MSDAREVIAEAVFMAITGYSAPVMDGSDHDLAVSEDATRYADAVLAALSAAGLTICGEQVGWRDDDGFLWSDRKPVDGPVPVFVPVQP